MFQSMADYLPGEGGGRVQNLAEVALKQEPSPVTTQRLNTVELPVLELCRTRWLATHNPVQVRHHTARFN